MWASKQKSDQKTNQKTLRDLPGLRPGPSASTWDDSGYYTVPASTGPRLSLNLLPQHAWNGGVKPKSSKNATTSTNLAMSQPKSLPVHSKDNVTTARPAPDQRDTVGISERVSNIPPVLAHVETSKTAKPVVQGFVKTSQVSEVPSVAGDKLPNVAPHLRTSEHQNSGLGNVVGENAANGLYVPPHLRIPEPHKQLPEPKGERITANNMTSPALDSPDSAEHHVESPSIIVPLSSDAESSPIKQSHGKPEASASGAVSLTTTTSVAIVVDGDGLAPDKQIPKLAPHLRASGSKAKPALTESPVFMQDRVRTRATEVNGGNGSKKPGINGVSKLVPQTGESKAANHHNNAMTVKNGGSSSSLNPPQDPQDSSKSKRQKKDKQKLNDVQEWDQPHETAHPLLGWDNKLAEHPVDWEGRSRGPIPAKEHLQTLESWAQASESAFRQAIDTALPEYTLGTGVIHNGSLSIGISDQAHYTRRLPNDPLTLARAEQTAQSMIEERIAKRQEEVTEVQLTKQEQRQLRRVLRQRDEEFANLPNPYKPKADIYIRPAQARDLPQIVEIYNHYVKTSAVALELDPLTQETWRLRMEDCRDEGYDMYVAVQKAGQGNGQNRRGNCEPIFGFSYAEDQNDKRSSCRFAALAQVYVSWKHLRIGVGRCLLDRVMAMLNINHHHKQGVEWVGEAPSVQREIKKVLIEIPYWDDSDEERAIFKMMKNQSTGQMDRVSGWKAKFLESVQFEYAVTLREIGVKQAILDKGKT